MPKPEMSSKVRSASRELTSQQEKERSVCLKSSPLNKMTSSMTLANAQEKQRTRDPLLRLASLQHDARFKNSRCRDMPLVRLDDQVKNSFRSGSARKMAGSAEVSMRTSEASLDRHIPKISSSGRLSRVGRLSTRRKMCSAFSATARRRRCGFSRCKRSFSRARWLGLGIPQLLQRLDELSARFRHS